MKALLQLISLLITFAFMGEINADDRVVASTSPKTVFTCESLKEDAYGFKTARNCKMADGSILNVLFKPNNQIEIVLTSK